MKALLLTAGLGTRLRPLTFSSAKAAIPLLDAPFVHYPLQHLLANKIDEAVLNLHAHPESVRKAVGGEFDGLRIQYSFESEILGPAGAIRKALPLLDDNLFIVMNGDMLMDLPLQAVVDQHIATGADVTLVIMKDDRYSGLYFEDSDPPVLRGFHEGAGTKYHYTGVQIVNRNVAEKIPENLKTDIFRDIYPSLEAGRILGYRYDGFWMEIGNLAQYLETSIHLLKNPLPERLRPSKMAETLVSLKATIAAGAAVQDSIVLEGASIEATASIDHCIIGWNVTVSSSFQNVALVRGMLPWYF
jgi:mannose-1-phosphate guanylyltransferase